MDNPPDRDTPDSPRLAAIRADLGLRLRPVNEHMAEEEFATLIDKMARLQDSFERRMAETRPGGERRAGKPERREFE